MGKRIAIDEKDIDEMCSLFREGISIEHIRVRFKIGRNKITEILRNVLGEEYKLCIQSVRKTIAKKSGDTRRGRPFPHTPEWNEKIRQSQVGREVSQERREQIKRTWKEVRSKMTHEEIASQYEKIADSNRGKKRSDETKRKMSLSRRGIPVSEETKNKMREAKRRYYEGGGSSHRKGVTLTVEEKNRISQSTKKMWIDGKFRYGDDSVMRSKIEKQAYEKVLAAYPDATHSYHVSYDNKTLVFDIFIPSKNLLIEVNGNYWHLNPKLYESNHYDKHRDVTAQEIWDRDELKLKIAKSEGYGVFVLWEHEVPDFDAACL
jgi:G:T-mismatch repair DNA endonuclease (very short patch repair protein)